MNKLIVLTLLIETVILGAERNAPNCITQIGHGSIQWTIYSDTDLSSDSSMLALKKLVFTGKDHTLDLRPVEKRIIKLHKKSLPQTQEQPKREYPWHIKHRGKLCLFAGASLTLIAFMYYITFIEQL